MHPAITTQLLPTVPAWSACRCVHFLQFTTTKGRTVKVGAPKATTPIKTLTPACAGGYL
jgi:hypothetical protein